MYSQPILPVIRKEAITVSKIIFIWVTEEPNIIGSIISFIFFIPGCFELNLIFGNKPSFIMG